MAEDNWISTPTGDALRWTFEVVDKATERMRSIEKTYVSTVTNLTTPVRKLKSLASETAQHAAKIASHFVKSAADTKKWTAEQIAAAKKATEESLKERRKWVAEQVKLVHEEATRILKEKDLQKQEIKQLLEHEKERAASVQRTISQRKAARHKGGYDWDDDDDYGYGRHGKKKSKFIRGFEKGWSKFGPGGIGSTVTGFATAIVGRDTLEFDKATTEIRRSIGLTDDAYKDYRNELLTTARTQGVLREDMVALAHEFARSTASISGPEGMKGATLAMREFEDAVGFSRDESIALTKVSAEFFDLSGRGLTENANEWARIGKLTTLSHEEMYGLIDAQKIALSLSQKHGDSLKDVEESLVRGASYYKNMGENAQDAVAEMQRLAAPRSEQDWRHLAMVMQMTGYKSPEQVMGLAQTGQFPLEKFKQQQALSVAQMVRQQGPTAVAAIAQAGLFGTTGEKDTLAALNEGMRLERVLNANRAKGISDEKTLNDELTRIRGESANAENARIKANEQITAATLSSGEKLDLAIDRVQDSMIQGLLPIADGLGNTADFLATKLSEVANEFSELLPIITGLIAAPGSGVITPLLSFIPALFKSIGKDVPGTAAKGGFLARTGGLLRTGLWATAGALVNKTTSLVGDLITENAEDRDAAARLAEVKQRVASHQAKTGKKGKVLTGEFGGKNEAYLGDSTQNALSATFNSHPLTNIVDAWKQTAGDATTLFSHPIKTYESAKRAYKGGAAPIKAETMAGLPYEDMKRIAEAQGGYVTSTMGSEHHVPGSKHARGEAIDIRTKDLSPAQISDIMKAEQAAGYKVNYETKPPDNLVDKSQWAPHLHVETQNAQLVANEVRKSAQMAKGQKPNDPMYMDSPSLVSILNSQLRELRNLVALLGQRPDLNAALRNTAAGGGE